LGHGKYRISINAPINGLPQDGGGHPQECDFYLGRDFDIHNSPLEEKILLSPHLGKWRGPGQELAFQWGPKNGVIDI